MGDVMPDRVTADCELPGSVTRRAGQPPREQALELLAGVTAGDPAPGPVRPRPVTDVPLGLLP